MKTLPFELIQYILSFVHDRETLLECSVVSYSFLTATRSQIFYDLRLEDAPSTGTFLTLCESPLCTFPLGRVHKLQILDRLLLYGPTLRRFECMFYAYYGSKSTVHLVGIGNLLHKARSLESFELAVLINKTRNSEVLDNSLAPHIDFSCNPHLRHLTLDILGKFLVNRFLERISSPRNHPLASSTSTPTTPTPTPTLESLAIPDLESFLTTPTDWSTFDTIIQKPYFSSLREITFRPRKEHLSFRPEELDLPASSITMQHDDNGDIAGFSSLRITLDGDKVPGFPRRGTLPHARIAERLEMLKKSLPLCYERGLLKPYFDCVTIGREYFLRFGVYPTSP